MVKYDYLTEEEGETLKQEKLQLRFKPLNHYSGLAPYLREQIRQDAVKLMPNSTKQTVPITIYTKTG